MGPARSSTIRTLAGIFLIAMTVPAVAQERVRFPTADTQELALDGYLFRPKGPGPFPAVVAMHGCGGIFAPRSTKFTERHHQWGAHLAKLGYLVLFPDSFNPRGVADVCKRETDPIRPGADRVRDAYGALAFLQRQSFVRPDAIALMGWSHGAITTLWASRQSTRARPPAVQTDFAVGIAFYPGCKSISETGYRPVFPVHMFVGELDDWTPAEFCKAFAEKQGLKITVYPKAGHGFDAPNQPKLVIRDLHTTASGTATIGTDPEARADVLKRVPEILAGSMRRH
jgi:dienelactone hydrolase